MADRNERIRIFEQTIDACGNDPDLQSAITRSREGQEIVWYDVIPAAWIDEIQKKE